NIIYILNQKNVKIYSVTNNCTYSNTTDFVEKFQFRHLLNQAEFESDQISHRINRSLKYRRSIGAFIGNPGFGYECYIDGNRIRRRRINKNEKMIIDIVVHMIKENISYDDIANYLNLNGHTFRGKPWNDKRVFRVNKII